MTVLRKQAVEMIEKMPENRLQYIIQIMEGMDGLYGSAETDSRRQAYNELMSMIKPLGDIDEKAELEAYREEIC